MRLLGLYAPGFPRKFHGRFGLGEGRPSPAPAAVPESSAKASRVKDSTGG
ncbi:hypothetical protein ACIQ1J_22840 [Streptomyces sp. NPDC097107]